MKERLSIAAVFAAMLLVAVYEYRESVKQIPSSGGKEEALFMGVSSRELQEMINRGDDFILVDVRSPSEYRNGHIPGAISIPFPEIKAGMKELDRTKTVVLYCRSGPWSRIAYREFRDAGFSDVRVLRNGIVGWKWEVNGAIEKK